MADEPAADRQALVEVINLGLLWHCLCAITRLEVPERLAARPLPLAELAAATGADPDALWRVLRLVADHHVVTFEGDRVGLTDRGPAAVPRPSGLAVGRLRHRRGLRHRPSADRDPADRPGGRPPSARHGLLGVSGRPP